jgi:hypothetical protein
MSSMSLDQDSNDPSARYHQSGNFDQRDSQSGDGRGRQHRRQEDNLTKWDEQWSQF